MSPRAHAHGTSWRLILSLAGLWLVAAIVLAAVAVPANAAQPSTAPRATTEVTRAQPAAQRPEAPIITLLLAAGAASTVAFRARGARPRRAAQPIRIR
jgi:hypothetical protein